MSRVHPIIRLDFLVRLFACPIMAIIAVSSRRSGGEPLPPALWLASVLYALVWPHVAYAFAKRGKDPARELRVLLLDAFAVGCGIALFWFRPVPTVGVATAVSTFLCSIGGPSLLIRGMLALAGGAFLTGALATGFAVATTTSISAEILTGTLLFTFQTMMGFFTYRTARTLVASRRQLEHQGEEIRRQNAELVEARKSALEAATAKSAFLATMSHEIRTPLNGVLGMTRLLSETPLTAEQQDLLRTVRVSGDTLLTIINDILDYSRVESGRLELEQEPLDVVQVVEESLEIVSERARAKGIELVCELSREVPVTILGDATRVRQVVTNLVGNAVKFTERGEIVVSVHQTRAGSDTEPAEITITIRDTGIGIAEDRIPLLFTAFSQADTSTTRRYGGTGLGLAISKRLVTLMGGDISVESVPGVGSTFRFNIRGRVAPLQPSVHILTSGAGKRVLVVDDNATNRRALCGQLALWGFEAKDAAGAGEAGDALQHGDRFDLAILDHHMPDVDGMTLAREIRANEACRSLPLILLSSSLVLAKDDPEGLFVARLLKPARQSSLFDSIMVALGAEAPHPSGAASPTGTHVIPGALSILVADDNEINRDIARLILRRFGSEADFVANGRDAVDRVAGHAAADGQKPYDLVLMDIHMPDMDGLEATRAIRQLQSERPARKWPRIVAMTANVMEEDRAICLAAGMDDYLTKPLDFEDVGRVLRQASTFSADDSPATPAPRTGGDANVGTNPAAADIVDWSRLEELGEYDTPDRAVVKSAISSLADHAPVQLEEIRQSAVNRDAAMLRASAHKLKGAASNIGAIGVADRASRLERAGKNVSFDDVDLLVDDLSTTLQTTLDKLRRYVERGTE